MLLRDSSDHQTSGASPFCSRGNIRSWLLEAGQTTIDRSFSEELKASLEIFLQERIRWTYLLHAICLRSPSRNLLPDPRKHGGSSRPETYAATAPKDSPAARLGVVLTALTSKGVESFWLKTNGAQEVKRMNSLMATGSERLRRDQIDV